MGKWRGYDGVVDVEIVRVPDAGDDFVAFCRDFKLRELGDSHAWSSVMNEKIHAGEYIIFLDGEMASTRTAEDGLNPGREFVFEFRAGAPAPEKTYVSD